MILAHIAAVLITAVILKHGEDIVLTILQLALGPVAGALRALAEAAGILADHPYRSVRSLRSGCRSRSLRPWSGPNYRRGPPALVSTPHCDGENRRHTNPPNGGSRRHPRTNTAGNRNCRNPAPMRPDSAAVRRTCTTSSALDCTSGRTLSIGRAAASSSASAVPRSDRARSGPYAAVFDCTGKHESADIMRKNITLAMALPIAVVIGLSGCGQSGSQAADSSQPEASDSASNSPASSQVDADALSLDDAWVKAAEDGMTAVFGEVRNNTDHDINLIEAKYPGREDGRTPRNL